MQKNGEDFPEGEAFKRLRTDRERREFLNAALSKIRFLPFGGAGIPPGPGLRLGRTLGGIDGGKVDVREIWADLVQRGVTTESGYFGSVHGRYSHALQYIAMFKGASDAEMHAFEKLINTTSPTQFEFLWNVAFDSRAGDVNDPSWWRRHYEPALSSDDER
jgi:hypothetical protein